MKQELLDEFVRRLSKALGENLLNVTLYGSAAADDFVEKVSDLNVLCVLERVGLDELEAAYPAIDWWLKKKQPAPVLLSREETLNARDAFAIEFVDIRNAYRILHGEDLVGSIEVDPVHHRHQVEHELRSRLLRLRGRFLAIQKDRRQVIALMTDSLPTFATLLRHAVLLAGGSPAMKKREVFPAAAGKLGLESAPFLKLLEVRAGERRLSDAEIRPLFESYLKEIAKAAQYVDSLDAAAGESAGRKS